MRGSVAGALLLCTTAVLAAPAALAAETVPPYAPAPDARSVPGGASTTSAASLELGATYTSSLPGGGARVAYSLGLDAASDAYVSVTAIPASSSTVKASDGIKVSVEGPDGRSCSFDTETFGTVRSPRPIAAWGAREHSAHGPRCKGAGTYYVIVERVGPSAAAPDAWDLELFTASEPPLEQAGATSGPAPWNSASPAPLAGDGVRRTGGAGFASAASVGQGVWSAAIEPGRTLFYKVPLGWGRQLYATAELGSASGEKGYTSGALDLSLYNPVRDLVDDASASYDGGPTAAALDPLPPVAYENRYAIPSRHKSVRFAGSYYLVVHLAADVAEKYGDGPFEVKLRIRVGGEAQAGPGYAGESKPSRVFEVASGEDAAAVVGGIGGAGGDGDGDGDTAMTVLAVSGIGAGTVVLVVLGVWVVVARRRAGLE
ncbi:hypothetical protein ACHBTE_09555 [Streptomyces sp. M41]|uniref:hypothetical protein n=1 Tax=Streptomyces sp. M41 TaxID=3059412 RepID=UPI00374D458A